MLGIDALYALGQHAQHAVHAFGEQGYYFMTQAGLVAQLRAELKTGVVVCVKGSAQTHMQSIAEQLIAEEITTV